VTIGPEHEAPRPSTGAGFSDAVTYAFGDAANDLFGIARVGLSTGPGGETQASGLAVLFA
jgi:hypothetical protein